MMDSIKVFKGYDKVNSLEDPSPPNQKPTRKPLVIVVISLIVLLTVLIGAMVGALIYESNTEPPESPPEPPYLSTKPIESIRAVCSVTEYPESCFASISSFNHHRACRLSRVDPELIFNISLRVAMEELTYLSSLPKTLISKTNDPRTESALKDCADLFDDARSELNRSVEAMEVGPGEKVLTEEKIGDIKTWVSAAMTGQETCLDGLEEMGSTVVDEVRAKLQKSKVYMSNCLAILSNIQAVLDKFRLTMH